MTFVTNVRGRGSASFTSCCVMVEPPDTMRPFRTSCHAARKLACQSTPW